MHAGFPPPERGLATSIGVLFTQTGMLLAFIFPPIVVTAGSAAMASTSCGGSTSGSGGGSDDIDAWCTAGVRHSLGGQLQNFANLQFVICAVPAALALLFFRTRPPFDYGRPWDGPCGGAQAASMAIEPHVQLSTTTQQSTPSREGSKVAHSEHEEEEEAGLLESLKLCLYNPHFWL